MKTKYIYGLAAIFATVLLSLSSCDMFKVYSTWTFEHGAYGKGSITVTPKNGADTGEFTFYPGNKKDVTWEGHSDTYYSYSYTCASGVYPKKYENIKVILFTY